MQTLWKCVALIQFENSNSSSRCFAVSEIKEMIIISFSSPKSMQIGFMKILDKQESKQACQLLKFNLFVCIRFRKCVVKAQPLIGHFWGHVGGVSRGVYLSTRTSRNNLLFAVAKAGEGKISLYRDLHHLKALLSENCLCKQKF